MNALIRQGLYGWVPIVIFGLLASACKPRCPAGTLYVGSVCKSASEIAASASANSEAGSQQGIAANPDLADPQIRGSSGATATTQAQLGSGGAISVNSGANMQGAQSGSSSLVTAGVAATSVPPVAGQSSVNVSAPAVPAPEACADAGAIRCANGGTGKRETCSAGVWSETSSCGSGEVCAGADAPEPGTCLPVSSLCAGGAGTFACDDSGTLFKCGPNSTIEEEVSRCSSLELCKPGVKTGACATCVPGKYQCTDKQLESCGESGQGFEMSETCATAKLCDATGRRCKTPACEAGEMKCQGNAVVQCNPDRDGFVMAKSCGSFSCNESRVACNVCSPGETRCSGNTLLMCSDGLSESRTPCSSTTPKCSESAGMCVECAGSETRPCGSGCDAGVQRCQNGRFGACEPQPKTTQEVCNLKDDDCDGIVDECPQPGSGSIHVDCRSKSGQASSCLPQGSYLDSCDNCSYSTSSHVLSCQCYGTDGKKQAESRCDLDNNLSGIWQGNDNPPDPNFPNAGKLVCGR